MFSGSEYPKKVCLKFETRSTGEQTLCHGVQHQGASDAIFRCSIRRHLVKLHVCKVCKALEYLEVIRYPMTATHSNMNVFHQFILSKMQNSRMEMMMPACAHSPSAFTLPYD